MLTGVTDDVRRPDAIVMIVDITCTYSTSNGSSFLCGALHYSVASSAAKPQHLLTAVQLPICPQTGRNYTLRQSRNKPRGTHTYICIIYWMSNRHTKKWRTQTHISTAGSSRFRRISTASQTSNGGCLTAAEIVYLEWHRLTFRRIYWIRCPVLMWVVVDVVVDWRDCRWWINWREIWT